MDGLNVPLHSFLIKDASKAAELPLALVQAIVKVESSGDTFAFNPEPHYRYLWNVAENKPFRALTPEERASERPPADFPRPAGVPRDAEWWGQQASWGLMQVMGGTARWLGFGGKWLPALCDPRIGLEWGCKYLRRLVERHGSLADAVAAYNAGDAIRGEDGKYINQEYVDKVTRAVVEHGYWDSLPQ